MGRVPKEAAMRVDRVRHDRSHAGHPPDEADSERVCIRGGVRGENTARRDTCHEPIGMDPDTRTAEESDESGRRSVESAGELAAPRGAGREGCPQDRDEAED